MSVMESIRSKFVADESEDKAKKLEPPIVPPKDVMKRIERGRQRLKQVQARRRQAIEFTNGNHYVWITEDRLQVNQQSTVAISDGGLMPDHRVRRSHDIIGPIIKRKLSASVAHVPGYEVVPTNETEEAYLAAQIAEKAAYAGYDKWEIKRLTKKLIWNALVTEEGFIGVRWDTNVGPFVDVSMHPEADLVDDDGNMPYAGQPDPDAPEYVGMGELKILVYGGLEVLSEPGVDFEESRWYAVQTARPVGVVEEEDDFIDNGEKLKPDAESTQLTKPNKLKNGTELVMQVEYLERPCAKWPEGRRLVMANGRVIFPEERYPKEDADGKVVDEPPFWRLSYALDAASDKNKGLVQSLIDPQRSYDMAMNKMQEYIQLGQNPQIMAPEGSIITPLTDEPGLVIETDPNVVAGSNVKPEWVQAAQIPQDLYNHKDIASEEMERIAFDFEVPQGIRSAQAIQAIFERNEASWADFIADLADVHAGLMRDCLVIVQRRYSEERLKKFKGAAGWEDLAEFRGADIRGQTDVRVDPGSLEPRTRATIEQRIQQMNAMFPGYFPPPTVIAAMSSADLDKLSATFENAEARVYRIIALIKNGGFWDMPPRPTVPGEEIPLLDPQTGEVVMNYATGKPFEMKQAPGWMPRPFDNPDIWKLKLETHMTTSDFDEMPEEQKQAELLVYKGVLDLQAKEAQRRAQLQTAMAESQGMQNAAAPQTAKELPSQPFVNEGEDRNVVPAGAAR